MRKTYQPNIKMQLGREPNSETLRRTLRNKTWIIVKYPETAPASKRDRAAEWFIKFKAVLASFQIKQGQIYYKKGGKKNKMKLGIINRHLLNITTCKIRSSKVNINK